MGTTLMLNFQFVQDIGTLSPFPFQQPPFQRSVCQFCTFIDQMASGSALAQICMSNNDNVDVFSFPILPLS